jgi:RNA polymerase sigma-70 factor (ECF subfamily)
LSHSIEQYSDAALLDLYKKDKDTKWIGYLFERYTLLVFGVCMKYLKQVNDAKDATQQVFEKAFVEVNKYEVTYFKSWMYSIARNHCLMQLRGKGLQTVFMETLPEDLGENFNSQELFDAKENLHEQQIENLGDAIAQLNQEQKLCIDLFYLQKLSYREIEEKTGFSFQQVKSHIQNGKRNLRIFLEQQQKAPGHE